MIFISKSTFLFKLFYFKIDFFLIQTSLLNIKETCQVSFRKANTNIRKVDFKGKNLYSKNHLPYWTRSPMSLFNSRNAFSILLPFLSKKLSLKMIHTNHAVCACRFTFIQNNLQKILENRVRLLAEKVKYYPTYIKEDHVRMFLFGKGVCFFQLSSVISLLKTLASRPTSSAWLNDFLSKIYICCWLEKHVLHKSILRFYISLK